MRGKSIFLFIWGYQEHYRISVEYLAKQVFEILGISIKPKALVIGVRRPESNNRNPVYVEPEDGEWSIDLFTGLLDSVEDIYRNHPEHNMFYGDETFTREQPERIRRDSVRTAVAQALKPYDVEYQVSSFCGAAYPIADYYVVPVVQVPELIFKLYPPLQGVISYNRISGYPSFIHAALSALLAEATAELVKPIPGRESSLSSRTAEEIVQQAASSFLRTPVLALKDRNYSFDLFEQFNMISKLMYEGTEGKGQLLLVNPENPAIDYALHLVDPVPYRKHR